MSRKLDQIRNLKIQPLIGFSFLRISEQNSSLAHYSDAPRQSVGYDAEHRNQIKLEVEKLNNGSS